MQTFRQYITEVFDNPFEWEWTQTTGNVKLAKFSTGEVNIGVVFDGGVGSSYSLSFGVITSRSFNSGADINDGIELKQYNASKILATVMEITISFVNKENPKRVVFSGDKSEIGRASIYKKMLDRHLPDEYTIEDEEESSKDVMFVVKRKEE